MPKRKTHPGTIEQRGDSFRVILYAGGTRHTFTLPGVTKKAAENFARAEHEKLQGRVERVKAGLPGAVSFSGLVAAYRRDALPLVNAERTRTSYATSLERFTEFFVGRMGDPNVDTIRRGHVRAFLDWRRTQRKGGEAGAALSNRTLAKDRAALLLLFKYACDLEYLEANPVASIRPPKSDGREPVILTDDQFEALLRELTDPMVAMYGLLLNETGCRAESEGLWLQWADVDLEQGFIRIVSGRDGHRTKSGKGRWVPMTPRLRTAMREHFARFRLASRSPWVFHHTRTRRNASEGDRVTSFRRALHGAAKRAGLPDGWTQHDLRHRRVTTWLADEKNPVHVKEAVGHADLRTTMSYTHLAREHLRTLVEQPDEREALRELGS